MRAARCVGAGASSVAVVAGRDAGWSIGRYGVTSVSASEPEELKAFVDERVVDDGYGSSLIGPGTDCRGPLRRRQRPLRTRKSKEPPGVDLGVLRGA